MRLPLDWRNEAAWAYLRGFIAATPEEAKLSEGSNTPRLHVKKLDSLWKTLQMWHKIAEAPEFSMDLVEGGNAEVVEFQVPARSRVLKRPLAELKFPREAIVGAVIRGEQIFVPSGQFQFEEGDQALVFTLTDALPGLERMFRGR